MCPSAFISAGSPGIISGTAVISAIFCFPRRRSSVIFIVFIPNARNIPRFDIFNLILYIIHRTIYGIDCGIHILTHTVHHPLHGLIPQTSDIVQCVTDVIKIVLRLLFIIGYTLLKGIHFPVQAVNRILILLLKGLGILSRIAGCLAECIGHLNHKAVHVPKIILQLFQTIRQVFRFHIRLCLACNASRIFSSQNVPFVFTVHNGSALSPGNASHIVAHMRISYLTFIGTARNGAGGNARNTAAVISCYHILGQVQFTQIHSVQIECCLQILSVYRALVIAVLDNAFIFSADSSGSVSPRYRPCRAAVHDLAVGLVIADNTSHGFRSGNITCKTASRQCAEIHPGQAADIFSAPFHSDISFNRQIFYSGIPAKITEESEIRTLTGENKAGYFMSAAFQGSVKIRDSLKIDSLQINISRQSKYFSIAVPVVPAILRQFYQILL